MTRDFPERLEAVRAHGVPYSEIITNGTLLNERSIDRILDARITCLTFSIDGGTKEIYEAIRVGARFETVMANLRLFQAMRDARGARLPELRINHVLSEPNIDHFEEFLALASRIRPERIGVRTVSRMSDRPSRRAPIRSSGRRSASRAGSSRISAAAPASWTRVFSATGRRRSISSATQERS